METMPSGDGPDPKLLLLLLWSMVGFLTGVFWREIAMLAASLLGW